MKNFEIVYGDCGAGKTTEIARRVKSLALNRAEEGLMGFENRIYVLVPDQYTLATEKFFLSLLGSNLMVYVRIYSFKRFCRLILERTEGVFETVLGNVGRKILALESVKEISPSFEFYPNGYKNMRFVNLVTETFRLLKSRGISAETFLKISETENNGKLFDIARSYAVYESLFSGEYFDPDDLYTLASKSILSSGILSETAVFADQFKTFNANEREVLCSLFESGAEVTVSSLGNGGFYGANEPMWGVEKNIALLLGKIKKLGGEIKKTVLREQVRFKNDEMRFLAENLFVDNSFAYNNRTENIKLYRASDLFDEVENAAAEISELIRSGYKYSDIAVTARDIDVYTGIIEPVFEEYGIPVFYHRKTPLRQKSPMTFILSVISAVVDGFSEENVLTAYKTGFLNAEENSVALLENYFRKWKYAAASFTRPFVKSPNGFGSDVADSESVEKLKIINNLREYFVEVVSKIKDCGKKNSVKNYAKALYETMTFVNMPDKIAEVADFYKTFEEHALYSEQVRVYDMIIDMLDELVFVCGEREVSLEDFRDVISSAAEESDIAVLPTSVDRVVTGTVAMLPFMSQKAVFILGCAEYSFPREVSEDKLFTDEELLILEEKHGIEIGMTSDRKVNYEKFLFTIASLAASEKCFFSYARKGLASSFESSYIGEIRRLFPLLSVEESPLQSGFQGKEKLIINDRTAFALYSRTKAPELRELLEGTRYIDFIDRGYSDRQSLSADMAERLFGKNIVLSYSKADKFSECPFSYFIRYGLNIVPERRAEMKAMEFGTLIHKGLEKLLPFAEDKDADLDAAVSDFSEKELEIILSGDSPTETFRENYKNVIKKLRRVLYRFREESLSSDFVTVARELPLSSEEPSACPPVRLPLSDGNYITMTGVIDRVDMFSNHGKNFYRVIDYKTGSKTFSSENIKNGIDMQLLIYLYSVVQREENAVPAGVSYVIANPAVVKLKRGEIGQEAKIKNRESKSGGGLILDDRDVINALDKNNVYSNKPNLDGASKVSAEGFAKLFDDVLSSLTNIGEALKNGRIPKSPLVYGKIDGCKYCDYGPFCLNKQEPRGSRVRMSSGKEDNADA